MAQCVCRRRHRCRRARAPCLHNSVRSRIMGLAVSPAPTSTPGHRACTRRRAQTAPRRPRVAPRQPAQTAQRMPRASAPRPRNVARQCLRPRQPAGPCHSTQRDDPAGPAQPQSMVPCPHGTQALGLSRCPTTPKRAQATTAMRRPRRHEQKRLAQTCTCPSRALVDMHKSPKPQGIEHHPPTDPRCFQANRDWPATAARGTKPWTAAETMDRSLHEVTSNTPDAAQPRPQGPRLWPPLPRAPRLARRKARPRPAAAWPVDAARDSLWPAARRWQPGTSPIACVAQPRSVRAVSPEVPQGTAQISH